MKFMKTAKCTWMDYKRNEDILKELKRDQYWKKVLDTKAVGFNRMQNRQTSETNKNYK
jgi:hypothetical protein